MYPPTHPNLDKSPIMRYMSALIAYLFGLVNLA
jgi:hypothetical protein